MAQAYHQRAFAPPPGSTEVILVRHGASAPIAPGERFPLLDGHGDPALAPEGEAQAEAVARRLAGEPIAGIYVTGLKRTVQTAAPLATRVELDPVVVPELREVRLGEWEAGEFRIRMRERDPIAMRAVMEERWDLIPGGESPESLATRVRAGIDRIVAATGPDALAVAFLHGGVIGEIARQATRSRPFAFIHADNASISRLVIFPGGRELLRSFNDATHLD